MRVSRVGGREGESYISPDVQREAIQRWADYKGVAIATWHVDEDWSGGSHERPGLSAAIERAVSGKTGGIVAWRIDRFSRATVDGLNDLHRLEEAGARLAFVAEDIDTSGPMGKFVYTVMLAMAEYFLANIRSGWKIAQERAVERGATIGKAPLGYRKRDNGTLEPDPDTARIVTKAYELAARIGIDAADAYLREHTDGKKWSPWIVRRFLANRVYLGEVRHADHIKKHAHPALVDHRTFTLAQHEATNMRQPSEDYPLSGVALCDHCGGPMVGSTTHGKRYYRCAGRCDQAVSILAEPFEEYVEWYLLMVTEGVRYTGRAKTHELDAALTALAKAESALSEYLSDDELRAIVSREAYLEGARERQVNVEQAQTLVSDLRDATPEPFDVSFREGWDSASPESTSRIIAKAMSGKVRVKRAPRGAKVYQRVDFRE